MSKMRTYRAGSRRARAGLGARVLMLIVATVLVAAVVTPTLALAPVSATVPMRVGLVLPLSGNAAALAGQEQAGIDIARDMVNAAGGAGGRPIELVVRDVERSAAADGLVYWESGAVADQLTGRGLPLVFRVGANGSVLGSGSAAFVAQVLAPRLGKTPDQVRVALVQADDAYASSVADAAAAASGEAGMQLVAHLTYHLLQPDWGTLMNQLKAAAPDVLILSSHIQDGVEFRRAMLAAGLKVDAFIGSTMAQCGPEWGRLLQVDAIGTFASDRPSGGFDPGALLPATRTVYDGFAAAWAASQGGQPSEEGLAGFAAAWALFHDVLPVAAAAGDTGVGSATVAVGATVALSATAAGSATVAVGATAAGSATGVEAVAIASAARAVDLPVGSLPNGAGLHFSPNAATLGQNERAASVIWQWQAIERSVTVWPPAYATGPIGFVPLPR